MTDSQKKKVLGMLKTYRRLTARLHRAGGPDKDGELLERVVGMEEDILAACGLSAAEDNLAIVRSGADDAGASPNMLISLLETKAAQQENRAPLEHFYLGLMQGEPAENVLPEMGLITHDYYFYLYDLVEENNDLLIDAYNEMLRAEPHLDLIGRTKGLLDQLAKQNLRYVLPYLLKDWPQEE